LASLKNRLSGALHATLFRSWLDAVGTDGAVPQKAMRHAGIRTTTNTYSSVVTDEIVQASGKVARLALNGTGLKLTD